MYEDKPVSVPMFNLLACQQRLKILARLSLDASEISEISSQVSIVRGLVDEAIVYLHQQEHPA